MKWNSNQYLYEYSQAHMYLIPKDFNWKEYVLLNPDLEQAGITAEQHAIEHFLYYGIKEKRKYKFEENEILPNNFKPKIYKFLNPDLMHLTDLQATQHYMNSGRQENRSYSASFSFDNNFDPRLYKLYNADLAHLTDMQAIKHYSEHGQKEGRTYYTGISYDSLMEQKNNQSINNELKNGILLINHDISLTGAPLFLYDLYDFFIKHHYFTNITIVEPYPNNILPSVVNKFYHFNDPQNLMQIIESLDPVLIYSNSLNLYVRNLSIFYYWVYKTIFHFHETHEPFIDFVDSNISLSDAKISVVSEKIKKEYLCHRELNNISVFPPFISSKKLQKIDNDSTIPCVIKNNTRELDKNKIIIGMSGSLCSRKNFVLFYLMAEACPDLEFVWIGGQDIDAYILKEFGHTIDKMPTNLFWIQNTTNPYKYFNMLDYFFLTSLSDPCPIVVLENLYLNKKIIVLRNNIHTEHTELELENFINIDNTESDTNEDIIEKFKNINLSKHGNLTNKNKEYILKKYSLPSIHKSSINDQNNYIICSMYDSDSLNATYYVNLINQFIVRNNFEYKCIIALSYDDTPNHEIVKELYSNILNIDNVITRKNRGYDIGGLIDSINYIFKNYDIDYKSKLAYTHSKSNIHWRNINDKIFYLDNVDMYDTICSSRFLAPCSMDDLNRPILNDNVHIFENIYVLNNEFNYIQGTVFRTKTLYLKTMHEKYKYISEILTDKDKNDTYWQSIMKNKDIFKQYIDQYSDNIFNNPIEPSSHKILTNNLAKNYIELYHRFHLRGIPDCQIEHAIERYIGFLITNGKKVHKI